MRKNLGYRKIVGDSHRITVLVTGYNHHLFLNRLKNNKITIYNAKKKGKKQLLLTVNSASYEKLFAIAKELCYNIRKIEESGRAYPIVFLLRNIGVLVGAIVFMLSIYLSSDRIYAYSFEGTGSIYKSEVEEILTAEGVGIFDKFSSIDLKKLSSLIRLKSDKFSFVSCEKDGNRLKINLVLTETPPQTILGDKEVMTSAFSGTIESVRLYRGTAIVKVGDKVKIGDPLISGYYLSGESVVKTGVLAVVSIISDVECRIRLDAENLEDIAEILAEAEIKNGDVISSSVSVDKVGDEYEYIVLSSVRYVLKSG